MRLRQPGQSVLEDLHGAELQRVADLLQHGLVLVRSEPVEQLCEDQPGLAGLLLGPLMAVDQTFTDLGQWVQIMRAASGKT